MKCDKCHAELTVDYWEHFRRMSSIETLCQVCFNALPVDPKKNPWNFNHDVWIRLPIVKLSDFNKAGRWKK